MLSLLRYFSHYKKEAILAPLFKLLEACFELLVPLVIARMVDAIIPNKDKNGLFVVVILLISVAVISVIMALIAQFFSAKAAVGFTKEMTDDLYQKVLTLPTLIRDSLTSDTLLTRLTSDTLRIQIGINSFLRLFLRAPIVVFGALIMAATINVTLSFYFLILIIALVFIVTLVSRVANRYYVTLRKYLDKLVLAVRENIVGQRVIRSFGQSNREIAQYTAENDRYTQIQIRAGHWEAFLSPATFIIVNGTLLGLIWSGHLAIANGSLEQGALIALVNYLSQILVELVKMVAVISAMNQAYISAGRIHEIMQQPSEAIDDRLPILTVTDKSIVVSCDAASFAYPNSQVPALDGISFTLSRGQVMGIIGGTGSGKSTLIDLLMGLYPISGGKLSLYYNGESPATLKHWRSLISLVPQKAQLFSGTIRSNLVMGLSQAKDDDLWKALEAAQAAQFVREKDGLDTPVDAFGRNFSGGQRQRLTIARALLHDTASILILDDATSALDYVTESNVLTAIQNSYPDKAVILISQRTNSISQSDQILVLDKGCVVGFGNHHDLLDTCTIYREIDASQHSQEVVG